MHKEFRLPDLGEGLTSATLRDWHVKEGDSINVDQGLCSVETAKAIVDIPAPFSGKIISLDTKVGCTIATGSVLCKIEAKAKEKPFTLESIQTQNILKNSTQGMSANRAAMFDNLSNAHMQIATATLTEQAIIKQKTNTASLTLALIETLKQHKLFNASYTKQSGLVYFDEIDIGLAIHNAKGLTRATIDNCSNLSLDELEQCIISIKNDQEAYDSQKARMTLSNIGSTGIGIYATPSIIPPGLATLAIGRSEIKPQWDATNQIWLPNTYLPLSLSFDHRIITGVEAAEFLRTFILQIN